MVSQKKKTLIIQFFSVCTCWPDLPTAAIRQHIGKEYLRPPIKGPIFGVLFHMGTELSELRERGTWYILYWIPYIISMSTAYIQGPFALLTTPVFSPFNWLYYIWIRIRRKPLIKYTYTQQDTNRYSFLICSICCSRGTSARPSCQPVYWWRGFFFVDKKLQICKPTCKTS